MRALITGIAGFAGSHLAENLLRSGFEVCGTALEGESLRNLRSIRSSVTVARIRLNDSAKLSRFVTRYKPNVVFHLAALAAVGYSFSRPIETMEVNLLGTVRLYEILRNKPFVDRIVFVSSADIFGPLPPARMPIKPDYPLQPVSPYGASKAAADITSYQYFRAFGLPIVRVRAFTHTGPRQQPGFAIPDFCAQIAKIEKTKRPGVVRVGNLSARRDLSDVRDIVEGYRLAAEKGKDGEAYILAAGKADTISSYLGILLDDAKVEIEVRKDPGLFRPVEVPLLIGDIGKARRTLGFRPRISIRKTLIDTLEYWRDN